MSQTMWRTPSYLGSNAFPGEPSPDDDSIIVLKTSGGDLPVRRELLAEIKPPEYPDGSWCYVQTGDMTVLVYHRADAAALQAWPGNLLRRWWCHDTQTWHRWPEVHGVGEVVQLLPNHLVSLQGTCPVCGRIGRLRKDGSLATHGQGSSCRGVGQPPKENIA